MKKLLAFALTPMLTLAFTANVFAATAAVDMDGGGYDIAVNAKYDNRVSVPTVYHVDVTWGAMEFTNTVSGTKTWNPKTHDFDIDVSDSWTANENEITVTNHSNTGVRADFTYTPQTGYETVTGSFSSASILLPTAEGKTMEDTALTGKTALTLSGELASYSANLTRVGTVTVAISNNK